MSAPQPGPHGETPQDILKSFAPSYLAAQEFAKIFKVERPTKTNPDFYGSDQNEPRPKAAILDGAFPYWGVLRIYELETIAEFRLTTLTVLLLQYHSEKGKYPDNLDEVLSGQETENASDPFVTGQIKYRKQDGGCVIYSIGPDLRDDSGMIIFEGRNARWEAPSRGDIVVRLPDRP